MKIDKVVVGNLEENCYILEKEDKILVIDPGDDFPKIREKIKDREVLAVLLTHRHFDHIGALKEMIESYGCPIYERENLLEKKYQIGPFSFTVIYTEGHSADSVSYYFEEEKFILVGDFVFKGTIGRCDLPTGDFGRMMKSIEKLEKYPNVTLYPGHGEETDLLTEKSENPYFR